MLRSHSPAAAQLMQSGFSSWQTADAALLQKAMRAEMPTRKQTVFRIERVLVGIRWQRNRDTWFPFGFSKLVTRRNNRGIRHLTRWFSFTLLVFLRLHGVG